MDLHTILSVLVAAGIFLTAYTSTDLILTRYSYEAGRKAARNMLLIIIITFIITLIWMFV